MSDIYKSNIEIDYVDGIMLTDEKGNIVYSVRFNPRFSNESTEKDFTQILGKNFLEVYTSMQEEESSIVKCIKSGKVIYNERQNIVDFQGNTLCTQNITLPIMSSGKVLGTIELSKDITSIHDIDINKNASIKPNQKNILRPIKHPTYYSFDSIITKDKKMLDTIKRAKLMAKSNSPVLVYGETGTGKELFVQSIHNYSNCNKGPFIAQNLASIPENLFESMLFGSSKGAFTGAIDKIGLFEAADKGTLFLDEINSMPLHLQSKLLRVLQDKNVRKVGNTKCTYVDVRIIAAMNVSPQECLENGILRKDLFFRLNVNSISIPPLRDRRCDIPLLVEYFINNYNYTLTSNVTGISRSVSNFFEIYSWPGNVRELQHIIESAINIVKSGTIEMHHLPAYLHNDASDSNSEVNTPFERLQNSAFYDSNSNLHEILNRIERDIIVKRLKENRGNVSNTAKTLGIPRQTLQYKLSKFNLD